MQSQNQNFQIVVVDNNSSDHSMNYIKMWAEGKLNVWMPSDAGSTKNFPRPVVQNPLEYVCLKEHSLDGQKALQYENPLLLLQASANGGFAAGNNLGMRYALRQEDCQYVWILNNDTVIYPKTLDTMVYCFRKRRETQRLGVLGTIQCYYNDPEKIQAVAGGFNKWKARFWNIGIAYNKDSFYGKEVSFDYVYGASMMMSKECLKEVGLLNETYFMYYEEVDFAERARKKGFTMAVCTDTAILHKHGATISREGEDFRIYYLLKNMIKFYKLYYPLMVIIPVVKTLLIMIRDFIRTKKLNMLYWKVLKESVTEYFYKK